MNSRKVLLGVDPGPKNVGWAVTFVEEDYWETGHLRLEGDYGERLSTFYSWLVRAVEQLKPEAIAVEVLAVARHNITFEIGSQLAAVVLAAREHGIRVATMTPSTHFKFVSGKGTYNRDYRLQMEVMVAAEHLTKHELAAAGCCYTALCYLQNRLPATIRGRVRWIKTRD